MLIDTHTHLYLPEFEPDNAAVVDRAAKAGVRHMIFPNIDASSVDQMKRLQAQRPEVISLAIGLHPTEISADQAQQQTRFVVDQLASDTQYVAIGEIGIDLYWDATLCQRQMEIFDIQMRLAAQHDLPVIIHCRNGLDQVLEVIDGLPKIPKGVFHSFGGTIEDVERIRQRGDFYFGINGIVTFKNSSLRNVLPAIGVDRLLLETDAPYLAPVPMRGRRNESAYIIHTAAFTADALNISLPQLEATTTASAIQLFRLPI